MKIKPGPGFPEYRRISSLYFFLFSKNNFISDKISSVHENMFPRAKNPGRFDFWPLKMYLHF